MVMPIGPLMTEHRLIERMIALMEKELERIEKEKRANFDFVDVAVDFIRTYADRLHHGKEEDILFRDLKTRKLEALHKKIMDELIEEHRIGRAMVKELVEANNRYKGGDENALEAITRCLQDLVNFYPQHIEKEDVSTFALYVASLETDVKAMCIADFVAYSYDWREDSKAIVYLESESDDLSDESYIFGNLKETTIIDANGVLICELSEIPDRGGLSMG